MLQSLQELQKKDLMPSGTDRSDKFALYQERNSMGNLSVAEKS